MSRQRRLVAVVCTMLLALCTASGSSADQYHNSEHHCSLRLPNGWKAMSAEDLAVINDGVLPGAADHSFAGFEAPENGPTPGAHVLLSVQKAPLKGLTLDQVTDELRQYVGRELIFNVERDFAGLSMPEVGEARFDKTNFRVGVRLPPEQAEFGEVHNFIVVGLGREGLVAVRCFAEASEFPQAKTEFHKLATSIKFDEGYEFEPSTKSTSKNWTSSRGLIKLVIGGLVLLVSAIAAWFKRKPKDKYPEKLQWDANQ